MVYLGLELLALCSYARSPATVKTAWPRKRR